MFVFQKNFSEIFFVRKFFYSQNKFSRKFLIQDRNIAGMAFCSYRLYQLLVQYGQLTTMPIFIPLIIFAARCVIGSPYTVFFFRKCKIQHTVNKINEIRWSQPKVYFVTGLICDMYVQHFSCLFIRMYNNYNSNMSQGCILYNFASQVNFFHEAVYITVHMYNRLFQEFKIFVASRRTPERLLKGTGTRDLIWLKVVSLERS